MMRWTFNWFVCLVIVNVTLRGITSIHQTHHCFLLPSELGPDWYKVPQPVPTGRDGKPVHEAPYIHMPCVETTVFDVGICGCTNLVSFIFTSVNKRKRLHNGLVRDKKVDPKDTIKRLDATTARPPAASLLINTRTGEVKECPFRASSRGPAWYLIREPMDNWRHMRCAVGTLFEKRSCTCVHKRRESRGPEKPDDANIIIIEEDFGGSTSDKTISKSLGISVNDIDFSANQRPQDIPFWRRQDLYNSDKNKRKERKSIRKSDVEVVLHDHGPNNGQSVKDFDRLDIGKDDISAGHKHLFLKTSRSRAKKGNTLSGGLLSHSRTKTLPLVLDSTNKLAANNNRNINGNDASLVINSNIFNSQKPKHKDKSKQIDEDNILKVLDEISTTIDALKVADKLTDPDKMNKSEANMESEPFDTLYYKLEECPKKPLRELGLQYFLLHVRNIGYIPLTCHGNTIYDHTICACTSAPVDTAYDEIKFPAKECTKRAIPALGPQYFMDHLIGVGYIPYVCHGNRIYDDILCTCV